MYPEHGAVSTLVAHADAAMRFAKSSGGATYCFFEARMVSGLREQTELLRDLRRALAQGLDALIAEHAAERDDATHAAPAASGRIEEHGATDGSIESGHVCTETAGC